MLLSTWQVHKADRPDNIADVQSYTPQLSQPLCISLIEEKKKNAPRTNLYVLLFKCTYLAQGTQRVETCKPRIRKVKVHYVHYEAVNSEMALKNSDFSPILVRVYFEQTHKTKFLTSKIWFLLYIYKSTLNISKIFFTVNSNSTQLIFPQFSVQKISNKKNTKKSTLLVLACSWMMIFKLL